MIIGLTGGIASGKSEVSRYLKSKGLPVVDADVVARQVVEPGTKGLKAIAASFGHQVIQDGALDRRTLRKIIFESEDKRLLLNSILHPIIHESILSEIQALRDRGHEHIVFDAPLLLENHLEDMCDVIWVVASEEALQIERVMKRDGTTMSEAKAIIDRQMSLEEKKDRADEVIDNNTTLEALYGRLDQLLSALIKA